MKLRIIWYVCSFMVWPVCSMMPYYGISHQDGKRTYSQLVDEGMSPAYTLHYRDEECNSGEYDCNGSKSCYDAVQHSSKLIQITKKNGHHLIAMPHMVDVLQCEHVRLDEHNGVKTIRCPFCPAVKQCKTKTSLFNSIREHYNHNHYARFVWICRCGEKLYWYRICDSRVHKKHHERTTGCEDIHVSLYDGNFVLTQNDTKFYVCSNCGKLCDSSHELTLHKRACGWQHSMVVQGCDRKSLHYAMQPQIYNLSNGIWRAWLPHLYAISNNTIMSMISQQRDNRWLAQCEQGDFTSVHASKKNALAALLFHYNTCHSRTNIYICSYCKCSSHAYKVIHSHICRVHNSGARFVPLRKPYIYNGAAFCKVVFTEDGEDTDNLVVVPRVCEGGYLGACPYQGCQFFAANKEGDIADIQQAIRDHYNQEHLMTHLYICVCGQFFYGKRMLDAHRALYDDSQNAMTDEESIYGKSVPERANISSYESYTYSPFLKLVRDEMCYMMGTNDVELGVGTRAIDDDHAT